MNPVESQGQLYFESLQQVRVGEGRNDVIEAYDIAPVQVTPKIRRKPKMYLSHENRSMDVSDITGTIKRDRFGHRLSVNPNSVGQFAGVRKGADNLFNSKGGFNKPSKNVSSAFSHLDTANWGSSLNRKSQVVGNLPNVQKVPGSPLQKVNPLTMKQAGVPQKKDPDAMMNSIVYTVNQTGNPLINPKKNHKIAVDP